MPTTIQPATFGDLRAAFNEQLTSSNIFRMRAVQDDLMLEVDGVNPKHSWRLWIKRDQNLTNGVRGWSWRLIKVIPLEDMRTEVSQDGGFISIEGAHGCLRMWAEHCDCLRAELEMLGEEYRHESRI